MEPNVTPVAQLPKAEGPVSLLTNSWNFLKIHWKSLVPLALVPIALFFVAQLLMGAGAGVGLALNAPVGIGFGIIGLIIILVAIFLMIISQAAVILAIQRLHTDAAAPIKVVDQYKLGMPLFGSILFLLLLSLLVSIGSMFLLIIPGIIVSVYIVMYMYALIIDGKKGFSALSESYYLIKGRWWGVFGRYIVLGLILIAAQLIMGIAFSAGSVVSMVLNIIINSVTSVFSAIYLYRLYISLKLTRSTEAPTTTFKNLLITFMVIGILGLIAIPVIGVGIIAAIAGSSEFRENLQKFEQQMKEFERRARESGYNTNTTQDSLRTAPNSVVPTQSGSTVVPPATTSPTSSTPI